MAGIEDADFYSANAGASQTRPAQCSSLRKNGYVLIKQRPCKIVDMSTSKTGKHGHAKVRLTGIDIFTQKKYEDICPSTHNMSVPNVSRTDYQLMNIKGGYLNLLDDKCLGKDDCRLPQTELGKEINDRFENGEDLMITILKAMGYEAAIGVKVNTN